VFFTVIVAAWAAYQIQSLISINQLGLGIWGWALSGLLIGYELNRSKVEERLKFDKSRNQGLKEKIPLSVLMTTLLIGIVGLTVSIPPYLAANKYYNALKSGEVISIQASTYLKPYDRTRYLYSAQIMADNNLDEIAIQIIRDASKRYPDSFELWQRWSQIPSATPAQIAKAKSEMKRLDPYNPDLK
jgi:hypothetical protein